MRLYYSPSGYDLKVDLPEGAVEPNKIKVLNSAKQEILNDDISGASVHIDELEYDLHMAQWLNDESIIAEQYFDVAGFPYFSLNELKDEIKSGGMQMSVSDEQLALKREQVEDIFDGIAGYSFCTKGHRQRIYADGGRAYILERAYASKIISLKVNGSDYDPARCSIRGLGMLKFSEEIPADSVIEIHYLHGRNTRTQDLNRFALLYAKSIIGSAGLDPRATGQSNEFGYMRYSVAGKDGATGIPEVDAFLSSNHNKGGQGLNRMFVL